MRVSVASWCAAAVVGGVGYVVCYHHTLINAWYRHRFRIVSAQSRRSQLSGSAQAAAEPANGCWATRWEYIF